ncbi:DUF1738 domain-containing protein [Mucilaginibacter corticis]|uniref:DUF1738 domain-containing protein n=1 Tax=Mucilaginibacter corticis TaxID=2597670 RepID=A0A556MIL7_9SPHI|nr:zincin-like metallopeptidase domain-containing protein [Mucilaginibacter corticis]TSJ39703.1 DUF1738 domain-containing protein [Mucilaginibacter corticis]
MSKQEFKPLPEQTSERMIKAIEENKSIFQKAMNPERTSQFAQPFNPSTGKKYTGPAALILMMRDKSDPRWMTANQASFNKTHVLKESKGTLINFFSSNITQPVMENGEQVKKENGYPKTERVTLDKPQLVDAWLFNGSQLKDLPPYEPEPQTLSPIERAQAIMDASNAFLEKEISAPMYNSHNDLVFIPAKDVFPSAELYYAAALHELTHWTGHEDRLNRKPDSNGTDVLIKEELRANLASIFISSELNLPYDLGDHVGYLKAFAQIIKEDPKELFKAASDAQKMADYVLNFEPKLEQQLKTSPAQLEKGDVIQYNEAQYTVIRPLKNKVFEMEKDGEKFKLSAKDNLYTSLLEAKKNAPQQQQDQEQEMEPTLGEEVSTGYKMKR